MRTAPSIRARSARSCPAAARRGEREVVALCLQLCGACYEVCPVKIDIPAVLLHLRREVVRKAGVGTERAAMRGLARVFGSARLYRRAQRLGRLVQRPARHLPVRSRSGGGRVSCSRFPRNRSATGGAVTAAREAILAAVRSATAGSAVPMAVQRSYRRGGERTPRDRTTFCATPRRLPRDRPSCPIPRASSCRRRACGRPDRHSAGSAGSVAPGEVRSRITV